MRRFFRVLAAVAAALVALLCYGAGDGAHSMQIHFPDTGSVPSGAILGAILYGDLLLPSDHVAGAYATVIVLAIGVYALSTQPKQMSEGAFYLAVIVILVIGCSFAGWMFSQGKAILMLDGSADYSRPAKRIRFPSGSATMNVRAPQGSDLRP